LKPQHFKNIQFTLKSSTPEDETCIVLSTSYCKSGLLFHAEQAVIKKVIRENGTDKGITCTIKQSLQSKLTAPNFADASAFQILN
jgi:hypothetical protein